jgi:ribosomal protein L16 Arg81 hydroxylase
MPDSGIGEKTWENVMIPGDAIWIPRGTFHHVSPRSGRVGFSFGVEGKPEPSTYI